MNKKNIIMFFLTASIFALPFLAGAEVFDNPLGPGGDVQTLIKKIINAALGIAGTIALAMLIYGGILYMVSGGNQETVDKGKKTITYAVVGLVVIILSTAIVNFIIDAIK